MRKLLQVAPSGEVTEYDRSYIMIYAELLDADARGISWQEAASTILGFDPLADAAAARLCWNSHLARARWIIGGGLRSAVKVFGQRPAEFPLD